MSFAGYGLTLFDVKKAPFDLNEIPTFFTDTYFVTELQNFWERASVDYSDNGLHWFIPELDSGDTGNPFFCGSLTFKDKGISFHYALYSTIITFVQWFRSIIPVANAMYFIMIQDLELIQITESTTDMDILKFLEK